MKELEMWSMLFMVDEVTEATLGALDHTAHGNIPLY